GGDAEEDRQQGRAARDDQRLPPRAQVKLELPGAERGFQREAGQRGRQDESDRARHSPSVLFTLSRSASDSTSLPQSTCIVRNRRRSESRTGIWRDGPFSRSFSVSIRRSQSRNRFAFAA